VDGGRRAPRARRGHPPRLRPAARGVARRGAGVARGARFPARPHEGDRRRASGGRRRARAAPPDGPRRVSARRGLRRRDRRSRPRAARARPRTSAKTASAGSRRRTPPRSHASSRWFASSASDRGPARIPRTRYSSFVARPCAAAHHASATGAWPRRLSRGAHGARALHFADVRKRRHAGIPRPTWRRGPDPRCAAPRSPAVPCSDFHVRKERRMPDRLPVVVLSHLRWNFVYQRPQHVLSRLAASRPVLFVEEPVHDPRARPHAELARPQPNVLVCRPHTPVSAPGFVDAHLPVLHGIIDELVRSEHIDDFVLWTYTPMPMPLVRKLGPLAIVYDCMDELSAFLGSPPELVPRERELFRV